MQDKIFNIIFEQDEISWKSIIYDLVKTEQMDPWDVDVSLLANKYIEMIKRMKEMDLRISGKVLLAAAVLLKIKSNRLIGEDIDAFDRMMSGQDDDESLLGEVATIEIDRSALGKKLFPRTPQPRKRKVSIYELVDALQKALQVEKKRGLNRQVIEMQIPEKGVDITTVINDLYKRINLIFKSKPKLIFQDLVPSDSKEDKVLTFIPLLHLTNQRKVDLLQETHLGDIEIKVKEGFVEGAVDKEMEADTR